MRDKNLKTIADIRKEAARLGFNAPTNAFFTWYRENVEDYITTTKTPYIESVKAIIAEQIFKIPEQEYRQRKAQGDFI